MTTGEGAQRPPGPRRPGGMAQAVAAAAFAGQFRSYQRVRGCQHSLWNDAVFGVWAVLSLRGGLVMFKMGIPNYSPLCEGGNRFLTAAPAHRSDTSTEVESHHQVAAPYHLIGICHRYNNVKLTHQSRRLISSFSFPVYSSNTTFLIYSSLLRPDLADLFCIGRNPTLSIFQLRAPTMTDIVAGRAAGHPLVQLLAAAANAGGGSAPSELPGGAAYPAALDASVAATASANASSELLQLEVSLPFSISCIRTYKPHIYPCHTYTHTYIHTYMYATNLGLKTFPRV